MKSDKIKNFLATPKGKLIAACGLLVFCWLLMGIIYGGSFIFTLPSNEAIQTVRNDLRRVKKDIEQVRENNRVAKKLKDDYNALLKQAWKLSENGAVETELRLRVSEAARECELNLDNLGAVRITKVNNDMVYADIDVSGRCTIAEMANFLGAIQALKPAMGWQRLDIRPDRRNQRGNNSTQSIVGLAEQGVQTPSSNINFNGTIRVICDAHSVMTSGGTGK